MKKKSIIEEEILFTDKKFFGDKEEHAYDCVCYDGEAICTISDEEDENAPKEIIVKYPRKRELTNDQKDYILEYRGLYDLTRKDIHYGDIMMAYGKIVSKR
jgi:hypothetical protein